MDISRHQPIVVDSTLTNACFQRGGPRADQLPHCCRLQVPPDVASRTIDFVYDPDADTADEVAEELANQFNLSSTDRDICAAALKEWIAKEAAPDSGS